MKLLLVTERFPPSIGGMQKHCEVLYEGLRSRIETILLKKPDTCSEAVWFFTCKKAIKQAFDKHPDITHVYFNDGLQAFAAPLVKKIAPGVTILATVHGLDVVFPNPLYQKRLVDSLKNSVDYILPVSTYTGEECIRRGVASEKIHVIPNGVETELASFKPGKSAEEVLERVTGGKFKEKKVLVSIGRTVRRKGFSWFANNVLPELPEDYIYIIVGPVEKNAGLKKRLLSLLPKKLAIQIELSGMGLDYVGIQKALTDDRVKDRLFYPGKLSFDELMALLSASHAFVMPNIEVDGDAEGFGLVALEAVMRGTVSVVSGIEGITSAIIDGVNGFHVSSGNAEEWVKTITGICGDEKKRTDFVRTAVSYTAEHFSWNKMVETYFQLIIHG